MPLTSEVTKKDIEFDGFRVWRAEERDVLTGKVAIHWYVSVGYRVTTQEGETWRRDVTEEITGPFKTQAKSLLDKVRNYVLTKEGL